MTNRKRVKAPVILQMEALECGAACLAMILAFYKRWIPLDVLRADCGVSRDGSNALNIKKAAEHHGLTVKANRYNISQLQEKCTYPAIIYWNFNHFVVLDGFKNGFAYLNDPARGRVRMPVEEFTKGYSSLCMEFAPGENFVPEGKKKGTLDFLKPKLENKMGAIVAVMITSVLAAIAGSIIPVFSRVFTDDILGMGRSNWYTGFILFFVAIIVFQLIASIINQIYIYRSMGKIAIMSNSSFMWHIFHMPMEFFSQRMSGDLANRQAANDTVASIMIGQLAPVVMNFLMLIFYLVVMLRYSVPLTILGLITIIINLAMARIISNKRIEISSTQMRDQSKLDSTTVSGINMIETIKAAGAENGFLERWSGFHASVIKEKVRFSKVNHFLGTLPALLQQLSSIAVLLMGVWSIMNGHFTAGLLLAFQAIMTSFMQPVNDLIGAGQSLQEMRSSLERIYDVMEYPADVPEEEDLEVDALENARKLSGHVEMINVTFGYSRLAPPLIKDFNMTLEPGKRIAFVGGSGSGKSTIAKLLSGLYQPWSGQILFDGKPVSEIPRALFKGSVAMVDQDVVLFRDTIENNIKMWDSTIEDFDMILAAKDASIHEDIMTKKGGYQHVLEEGGSDFSGGQRQRIEIARVLAMDPSIIIMDEATSALDARTEYDVSEYMHARGISCIIVAHRLSTIRDCDEIIVMDCGEVVERGTHEELMAQNGMYKKLVTVE